MGIKVSKSKFFPQSNDIDGLGWSPINEGKLQKTAKGYSIAHKKVVNDGVIFDVTYNFDTLYRRHVSETPSNNLDCTSSNPFGHIAA